MRVSNEQRETLINLLESNPSLSLRNASEALSLNYESLRAIWNIYKRSGRRYAITGPRRRSQTSKKTSQRCNSSMAQSRGQGKNILKALDRASEELCELGQQEKKALQYEANSEIDRSFATATESEKLRAVLQERYAQLPNIFSQCCDSG